jgi:lipooligosaccharide transport system permease protein
MKNDSIWHPPQLSMRWWPVFLRNLLVWRKLAIPSLVGNIAEPLMWLVAFGYGLGSLVGQIQLGDQKVPYILFLASGSICMSAMNAASFEALYSAFSRMHVQKTWDGIMNAPVRLDDVVMAEMLWAAFKALFTVTAILGVMLALGISHSPKLLVAWPILLFVGISFSCIALIFNALAKGYDFFTYYFTLFLTPMMFLSGIFFPTTQLPPLVRSIAEWLPLTAAVELVRPLFMDQWPANPCGTSLCWRCSRSVRSGSRWPSPAGGSGADCPASGGGRALPRERAEVGFPAAQCADRPLALLGAGAVVQSGAEDAAIAQMAFRCRAPGRVRRGLPPIQQRGDCKSGLRRPRACGGKPMERLGHVVFAAAALGAPGGRIKAVIGQPIRNQGALGPCSSGRRRARRVRWCDRCGAADAPAHCRPATPRAS